MDKVIIIQARMQSTRLPNKMLFKLHGFSICEWVFRRLKNVNGVDAIFFALTDRGILS